MPVLRNPGPWSFAIFCVAAALVAFLYWKGAPDAVKLAGSLVGVAVAAFGARSALAKSARDEGTPADTDASKPPMRKRLPTWGDDDDTNPKGS